MARKPLAVSAREDLYIRIEILAGRVQYNRSCLHVVTGRKLNVSLERTLRVNDLGEEVLEQRHGQPVDMHAEVRETLEGFVCDTTHDVVWGN